MSYLYAVAIGSNRGGAIARFPKGQIAAALAALDDEPMTLLDASPIIETQPVGPRQRRFVNCAALVASPLLPDAFLHRLHAIEAEFGRTRQRRWGARRIDLDLILWSEGNFADGSAIVPHPGFRQRRFVLEPLLRIAPEWHDPLTGLSIRHLFARNNRRKPVDRSRPPH